MRGLAWMAILSALFLFIAVIFSGIACVTRDWYLMADAGVLAVVGAGLAMLSLRE